MKFVKVITIVVLSLSSLVAVACLGLLSAEDYMIKEQAAYEDLAEPQIYDPEIFAYDANRGELREEYFGSVSISCGADNMLYVKGGQTSKTNKEHITLR
jgi:hypothetical protein